MKLNLQCGEHLRNGYVNINSHAPNNVDFANLPANTSFYIGNFRNLSNVVNNEKAEEIIFNPFLNILNPSEILGVMKHWKDNLSSNGVLKVQFVDIVRLSDYIRSRQVFGENLHKLIFGPNQDFACVLDSQIFQQGVSNIGVQINYLSATGFIVTAELTNRD